MWQMFLLLWQNFHIFVAKFGKVCDFKWQFSTMIGMHVRPAHPASEMHRLSSMLRLRDTAGSIVTVQGLSIGKSQCRQ